MTEILQHAMWGVTGAAIAGAWLNVRKQRSGFAVWCFTNAANAAWCIAIGQYAQAGLFVVFLALAIWGWIAWGK